MVKHKVDICVSDKPVFKAGELKLPRRIIRWLFGDFQQIYLISPGKTINQVKIKEVSEDE